MSNEIIRIFPGQVYITADGKQFTVVEMDSESGYTVIENPEGDQGIMALGDLLGAARTGEIICVDEEDEEAQDLEKTD